jgi:predicted O-methyltransferase YrrM
MERYDIINTLIRKYGYKSYLEIGTQHGNAFTKIDIPHKVCVDPVKRYDQLTYEMTSDEFFANNKEKFDIIFVDGLHLEEQCSLDIKNSLKVLNKNGTIVVHDCLPHCEGFIKVQWNGTVFRSIIDLRYNNQNVVIEVVDTDNGCGVIRRGKQSLYNAVDINTAKTYNFFANNRDELMNVISTDEFLLKYS